MFDVGNRPTSVCQLATDAEASKEIPIRPIALWICRRCSHVWNSAFDESFHDEYSGAGCTMYNSGTAWQEHIDKIVAYVNRQANGRVLEIGAGDGEFLAKINKPKIAYEPSDDFYKLEHKGISAVHDYYIPGREKHENWDFIVMRHVLEHIHNPKEFMENLRESCVRQCQSVDILIEVPCVDNALHERRLEDWTYEHPNHFTHDSLEMLMQVTGWWKILYTKSYGNEVMVFHGHCQGQEYDVITRISRSFKTLRYSLTEVKTTLDRLRQEHPIVFWGGAGKSMMTLFELMAPGDRVVDSDQRKFGRYVPGTDTIIESPKILNELNPIVFITTNWREQDIREEIERCGLPTHRILTLKNGELNG
jgi:SAM-dependent methyltransferase